MQANIEQALMTAATANTPCPLWRRLTALVYDLLAVVAIVMVVGLLCQIATHGQLISTGAQTHIDWWYQPVQGLVVAAYFIASWLRGGQTLGMRPWHIRITAHDGGSPRPQQALLRLVVAALPLLMLGLAPFVGIRDALWAVTIGWALWLIPILFDTRRRAVHDLVASTEIRRID